MVDASAMPDDAIPVVPHSLAKWYSERGARGHRDPLEARRVSLPRHARQRGAAPQNHSTNVLLSMELWGP